MAGQDEDRWIFEYLDYRQYLLEYYQTRKQANPGFSLRVFSDKIGFRTKDFILRVMRGEKNLSDESIPKVGKALGLGRREFEFFLALVHFNQAEIAEDRDRFYAQMQATMKAARFTQNQYLLAHHQYQVYSSWAHLAVRSLIGMHGFSGDYAALASLVHPQITPEAAKHSVALLESCQLIEKTPDGHYRLTSNAITTGDRTSRLALRNFHQSCLKLASDAIDRDPSKERNISGLTLGISATGYAKIIARLDAFRKEIAQIAEEDAEADRVYQLDLVLFPLSHSPDQGQ